MIYLLKDTIKFSEVREEKIIPLLSLTNTNKIHISSINVGDLIFDINGSIASVIHNISEKECKVLVLTVNKNINNDDDDIITSFR